MTINDKLADLPATRADVATVAIHMTAALYEVVICLHALRDGREIPDEALKMHKVFDMLAGWNEAK
jgi:hypothetical protein